MYVLKTDLIATQNYEDINSHVSLKYKHRQIC